MLSGRGWRRAGWVALAGAVALAAAGGGAAGLGAPPLLAAISGAVATLVAGAVVGLVLQRRDARAAALARRDEVLDALTALAPGDADDVLRLLRADQRAVPFRGRSRELRQLAACCADNPACPALMVSGPAGVGKSRLVLEFALALPPDWTAGWLHAGAGSAAINAVRACGDPSVVLVDDADGRADVIALLDALAEHHDDPQVRVVLVTRSAAGLREWLALRVEERHRWIADRAVELEVTAHGGTEDRQRWFAEAVAAFASARRVKAPDLQGPLPAGFADADQSILALQAQALLTVLGGGSARQADPRALTFSQVAESLIGHEKRRWRAMSSTAEWGIGGPPSEALQERCIAALALLGAANENEATAVLNRIPELDNAFGERLAGIMSWIAALYPADPGGAPEIRPDMIGEWFVVSQLTAHPALARSLRDGLTDAQAAHALGFLARAADRIETAGDLFEAFSSCGIRYLMLAGAQAATTGSTGRRLLDRVLAGQIRSTDGWTVDQLADFNRQIPEHVLLATHVAVADLTVTLYRGLAEASPAEHQADLAMALTNLSTSLVQAGEYQNAVKAAGEAVTLYRGLAEASPAEHQADLAATLSNLGNALGRAGEDQDAVKAAGEAVTLYRGLAKASPAEHQANLASALTNLGTSLFQAREYQGAVKAAGEAVALWRDLAKASPAEHQADLAMALSNLSGSLSQVGEYRNAVRPAVEAVTLYRGLAETSPAEHQARLAGALTNLGLSLGRVREYQDAIKAAGEAVTLDRDLAEASPAAYKADLAATLTNLGSLLGQAGEDQNAVEAAGEAVPLYRDLAKASPAAHQADLASALTNLGASLGQAGQYQDALKAAGEAVALWRDLAKAGPAAYKAGLASALTTLGFVLYRAGDSQNAIKASREAVTLLRGLAEASPVEHQAALANALENLRALNSTASS